ncbi:MAG: glycerol-3-phosphate dehydrogenase/oxidase [Thermoleophilaceae bacterium]|nr:glycerol-3-phosphate dehydrogenase/oxidase [Thermoleophilaceae bacterium]
MIERRIALNSLAEDDFDVLVIGGGITGAGVALDAASRGLSVALIERDDFACGTSSRSSKMVHGGLRYLQNFDIALVREALIERRIMVEMAPHLVWPTPFLVTAFEGERIDRKVGIGLNMYDVMQRGSASSRSEKRSRAEAAGVSLRQYRRQNPRDWSPERHRVIEGEEVRELVPALADAAPRSAYLFYDCQTDDARLVLTVLGEAERYGALIANRLEATELIERDGKIVGVKTRETESGADIEITARHIVSATGVWADQLEPTDAREQDVPTIRPSRGTHITLSNTDLPLDKAAVVVPAGEGRMIFALPWMGRTLVGTTDNDYEGDLRHIAPGEDDVQYLLDAVNNYFSTALTKLHITGAYAGARPLISTGDSHKSVDISRKAELYESPSGMITITGGKLTTWRPMAAMVVDRVVARERREAPCRTEEIPLGQPMNPEDLVPSPAIDDAGRKHLAGRYGFAANDVLELAAQDPQLGLRIVPDMPDRLAEVVIAVRREQARSISDVLLRRTRLGLLAARDLVGLGHPAEPVESVAALMGRELGWSDERRQLEIKAWDKVAAEEGILPQ